MNFIRVGPITRSTAVAAVPEVTLTTSSTAMAETGGSVTLTATADVAPGSDLTVPITYTGTATSGGDYSGAGDITILNGATTGTVVLSASSDTTDDDAETIIATIDNVLISGATVGSPGSQTITITDDDPPPAISIGDVTESEGLAGTTAFNFLITLDRASNNTVTVNFATADGTAVAGSDYTANSGTVTFVPGDISETVTVLVDGDTLDENDETFSVSLTSPSNATIAAATGLGTITNDDTAFRPALSSSVTVAPTEGDSGSSNARVTVELDASSGKTVSVDYATSDISAVAGVDYTSTSGTLTFLAGETLETIDIPISGDQTVEADETFSVAFSNTVNGDASGLLDRTLTILNDDSAGVTVADVTVNENAGTATLTLSLDAAVDGGFDVDVSTSDGTATTSDNDYTAVNNQTLTFAGTVSETEIVTVTLGGDTKVEADETLGLAMSNLVPVTVNAGAITITDTATLTILNDDAAVVTIANESGNEDDGAITMTVTLDAGGGWRVQRGCLDGGWHGDHGGQ